MSLGRDSLYNLAGASVPIILALVTVPAYLALLGTDRFGLLAVAWVILGYFGLFDLGLGRATAQRLAALGSGRSQNRDAALSTAVGANVMIGLAGAAIMWACAWPIFALIQFPRGLEAEVRGAVPLLAVAVPMATTSGVLAGALQGSQQFREVNQISSLSAAIVQLLPLAIAWWWGPHLVPILFSAVAGRLIGVALLWRACEKKVGSIAAGNFDRAQLKPLLAYGGWVTLTSMFGPLLVVVDRIAIGAMLGATAVAVYSVPMQVTQRLTTVANAIANAAFPRFAAADEDGGALTHRVTVAMLSLLALPALAALVLIEPALVVWVGKEVGSAAAGVGRILIVAHWLNAFAHLPYAQLQAEGRPDLVTAVLLAQIPFYLAGLYFGLAHFGIMGAALVFLARTGVDYVALSLVAGNRLGAARDVAAISGILFMVAGATEMRGEIGTWTYAAVVASSAAATVWVSVKAAPPGLRTTLLNHRWWRP